MTTNEIVITQLKFIKMITGKSFGGSVNDDYETPFEAWELIYDYLPVLRKKVWCPFFCNGALTSHLKWLHANVYHQKKDFYEYQPSQWDCIIDNPPYSTKKQVFSRCVKLGKPFALLVPLDTLERKYFAQLIDVNKLTVIIPKKRYNYSGGLNKKNCPFKSVWVCYGFDIEKGIVYE